MSGDEEDLRTLFQRSVPPLPEPPDRMAAVAARVRRTRATGAAATLAVAALGAGLVLTLPGTRPDGAPAPAAGARQDTTSAPGASLTPDALLTPDELRAFRDRVKTDDAYWQTRGIHLNTVAVDADGTVRIAVAEPSDVERAEREIRARYAGIPLRITTIVSAPPRGVPSSAIPPGSAQMPPPS